jgi:acyl dehydratase
MSASSTRQLSAPPGAFGLLLRASLPLIPGASALPFVAGGGHEIPATSLMLSGARLGPERLAAYARVCGFTLRDTLPATAPHVLAFPLHMALMTDGSFPFAAVGLVHVSNRIAVHRPIGAGESLDLCVHATSLESHSKGRTFALVTEAHVGDELVWEERSTMLRRGGGDQGGERGGDNGDGRPAGARGEGTREDVVANERPAAAAPELAATAEWRLSEDLGRRYAAVSGDRNPIHMHSLSAKLFGFPRAIVHGMWTKARCLAALEASLPDAYAVEVEFRKPIFLPGRVDFAQAEQGARAGEGTRAPRGEAATDHLAAASREGLTTSFAVRSAKDETTIHLEGTVTR